MPNRDEKEYHYPSISFLDLPILAEKYGTTVCKLRCNTQAQHDTKESQCGLATVFPDKLSILLVYSV